MPFQQFTDAILITVQMTSADPKLPTLELPENHREPIPLPHTTDRISRGVLTYGQMMPTNLGAKTVSLFITNI